MEPYQYTGANITVFRIVDPTTQKMDAFFQYQEEQADDDDGKIGDSEDIQENVCATEDEGKMGTLNQSD